MIPVSFAARVLTSKLRDKRKCAGSSQQSPACARFALCAAVSPLRSALANVRIEHFPGRHMLITDAQVHLWEPNRPDRPWPGTPIRPPHRLNGFSAEETLVEMDLAGVDRAVVVPPNWVGDNNQTALEAAARYPTLLPSLAVSIPKPQMRKRD